MNLSEELDFLKQDTKIQTKKKMAPLKFCIKRHQSVSKDTWQTGRLLAHRKRMNVNKIERIAQSCVHVKVIFFSPLSQANTILLRSS